MKTTVKFWEPGISIFTDELAKEERKLLDPLEAEMTKSTDPIVKARLKEEIRKIKTDFKDKRKSVSRSLFAKA
ncbi:MAG: hypothetical protein EOM62_20210 [Bacteroidia bacterium]|nr:hypothetical protein [Bacteroidia bacterium]